jgi:hypothetical protein
MMRHDRMNTYLAMHKVRRLAFLRMKKQIEFPHMCFGSVFGSIVVISKVMFAIIICVCTFDVRALFSMGSRPINNQPMTIML